MGDEQHTFHSPNGEGKIGAVLEQARKEQGLTLDDVEQATKIRKRYLSGLEREDFDILPDAVYTQGFLKTYANYLGLDGEELSRQLKSRRKSRRERSLSYSPPQGSEFERPLISPGGLAGTHRRRVSGATIFTLLVAVVMIVAVIGTLYYVGLGARSSGGEPSPPERVAKQDDRGAPKEEAPQPSNAQAEKKEPAAKQRPLPPDTLTVAVNVFERPSWLEILADGTVAYEGIAQPGFSRTFEAKKEISINSGDAGAVQVEVNGQSVGVLGGPGEVLTRNFTLKDAA